MEDIPHSTRILHDRPALQSLIERVNNSDIATLRQNVVRILTMVHNPGASARNLSELIETDPPLSSRILRVANSAYFGSHRHIGGIREAIIWLGFATVKELALSQTMSVFFERNGVLADFSLQEVWRHSLLTAVATKLIYRREFGLSGETAYTAGLLHEIGLIIEAQFCQQQFADAVAEMGDGNLRVMEQKALGFDHCEVGGALAADWGFPSHLVESILHHHDPMSAPEENRRLAQVVFIAEQLTLTVLPSFNDEPHVKADQHDQCMRDLGIEPEGLQLLRAEMEVELEKLKHKGLLT